MERRINYNTRWMRQERVVSARYELIIPLPSNSYTETGVGASVSCPSMRDRWSFRPEAPVCSLGNPQSHLPLPPPVAPRHTWFRFRTCIRVEVHPDRCIRICRLLCNPHRLFPPCTSRHRSRSPTLWNRPRCRADIAWWSAEDCQINKCRKTFSSQDGKKSQSFAAYRYIFHGPWRGANSGRFLRLTYDLWPIKGSSVSFHRFDRRMLRNERANRFLDRVYEFIDLSQGATKNERDARWFRLSPFGSLPKLLH